MKSAAGVAARTVARTTAVRTATATRCLGTVLPGHPDPALVKKKTDFVLSREESQYELGKHRSNALELIEQQDIIEVDNDIAICDGGGGALGHPVEYILLANRQGAFKACIYCGLKYRKMGGH